MEEHVHLGLEIGLRRRSRIGDDVHFVNFLVADFGLMLRKHDGDRASDG